VTTPRVRADNRPRPAGRIITGVDVHKAIVLAGVVALAAPPHASAAEMRVKVYVGSRMVHGNDGHFLLVSCHADAIVEGTGVDPLVTRPAQTTSWCAVDGDPNGWLKVNDVRLVPLSPMSSSGGKAMSFRASAFELPVTVCAGGSAVFNEGVDRTYFVDAVPACEVIHGG
jgi:hypothetical protein